MQVHPDAIPPVLAGPILRRTSPTRVTLWLATRSQADVRLEFDSGDGKPRCVELQADSPGFTQLQASRNLCYLLIDLSLS
ncbi:MAG: hypothetical protein V7629_14360 [Motiliproteus sp.]